MNKIFLGLGILASSMAMVSCSQDDFDNTVNNPVDDGSRFYTQLTISLPTAGSRAGTTAGEEIGQEGENKIKDLTIVLMNKEKDGTYKFVAQTEVTAVTSPSSTKPTYQAIFSGTNIKDYYAANPSLSEYKLWMFVIANNSSVTLPADFNPVTSTFDTEMLMGYNEGKALLMTGAPYEVTLPTTSKELMQYDNNSRPYNLTSNGAVKVERAIARFDYKSVKANDTYEIKDNNDQVIGKIKLQDMAIVNERTQAYHFGRSSDNGQNSNFNFELVANTTTKTFVVSPNADDLSARSFYSTLTRDVQSTTSLKQEFGYVWQNISALTNADNDNSWNSPNTYGDYKIWRYVNENTIPGVNDQKWKNSTGVVFRATIEDSGIPGYGNGSLYLFQNKLYGNFAALKTAATHKIDGNLTNPVLNHYFKNVWGAIAEDAVEDSFLSGETPKKHGFTVYKNESKTSEPLYYTYYYYWNRHQDNGEANTMGEMEFAVVRNNVYKLAVTSINRFGHTTDDDDDPDPVNPDDPDEKENIFFKVDVQVLPWTVRVNNIDF